VKFHPRHPTRQFAAIFAVGGVAKAAEGRLSAHAASSPKEERRGSKHPSGVGDGGLGEFHPRHPTRQFAAIFAVGGVAKAAEGRLSAHAASSPKEERRGSKHLSGVGRELGEIPPRSSNTSVRSNLADSG
jgi:hypothetical protein